MSDEDIYEAPALQEEIQVSSVAKLKRAFELQNRMPIQVATDGRFQSKDNQLIKPNRPSTTPKPNNMPDLPAKLAQLRHTKKPVLPPGANNQTSKTLPVSVTSSDPSPTSNDVKSNNVTSSSIVPSLPDRKASSRKSSDRDSIYPPSIPRKGSQSKKATLTNGVGSEHLSKEGKSPQTSVDGAYRIRSLPPPPGHEPPPKPSNIDVNIDVWVAWSRAVDEGVEPDEIYDDVMPFDDVFPATPAPVLRREDDDLPPPPSTRRPVSEIPAMSEDDELRELGKKTGSLDPIHDESDELYDDVGVHNDDDDDDIYQDIE